MINYPITNPLSTVILTKAQNGFTVTVFEEYEDGKVVPSTHLVEENESLQDFLEPDFNAVERLVWTVLEALGIWNSKHFKRRIEINVVSNQS